MKSQMSHTWQFFFLILALAAMICGCSSPVNTGEITDQPEDESINETNQADNLPGEAQMIDLFEEQLEFVMPNMPGRTIPLDNGGSIFIPEGALPQGTAIDAQISKSLPLLPEGFTPVGDSLIITADSQPQSPVLLRIPIPPGFTDPTNLAIFRVESNGNSTLLMTDVDEGDLVAFTPGFSRFTIAEHVFGLMRELKPLIIGRPEVLPGQPSTYQVMGVKPGMTSNNLWTVNGDAKIHHQDDVSLTIIAGQKRGFITITYAALDVERGVRLFSSRIILIETDTLDIIKSSSDARNFQIVLTSERPKVFKGDSLDVAVSFHGIYRLPVLWEYQIEGCNTKIDVITSNHQSTPLSFNCAPGQYKFRVYAEYLDEKNVYIEQFAVLSLEVFDRPLMVQLTGPTELNLEEQSLQAIFTAEVTWGDTKQADKKTLYDFSWRMLPSGEWMNYGLSELSVMDEEFIFNQPGDYRVEVLVKNQDGEEVRTTLPVLVMGNEPLNAQILSWPDTIKVDEAANFSFRTGGGTLVTGGQKGGYKVSIYWGDSTTIEESDVGMSQTMYEPAIFELSHQWAETGPYTVMLFVEDSAGNIAYAETDIVVNEKALSDRYEGVVRFEYMGVQGDMPSFVELTITGETVTAILEITIVFEASFPDSGKYCKENFYHLFSGEGPFTNPLSVEMALVDYNYSSEGNSCSGDDNSWDFTTTIEGDFYEDGSFSGIWLDQNGQEMIGYKIIASKVE